LHRGLYGANLQAKVFAMTQQTDTALDRIGRWLAGRLEHEVSGYVPYTPSDPETLRALMRPGDVLLVEGNQYISKIVKYLTTSTWSHSAIFVGPVDGAAGDEGEPHVLIEVNLGEGCVTKPLSKYCTYNTRICRPVGLAHKDRETVVAFMVERIGLKYDNKNILDMLRYFLPVPIPQRWRRRAIALGSGDPTRAICSSLIAQAFQSVRYPILPKIENNNPGNRRSRQMRRRREEIYYIRHHSLFSPRDFDLSPYFAVVKPTIERGFDYHGINWHDGSADETETVVAQAGADAEPESGEAALEQPGDHEAA
jgi:hypothetical protein